MKMFKYFFFISFCLSTMVAHANKLSVSGKPQDEAYCSMLGSPQIRNNDKKCKKTEIKKIDEWYEVSFEFNDNSLKGKADQKTKACANPPKVGREENDLYSSVEKQLDLAAKNNIEILITSQENSCMYKLKTKNKQAICSNEWGLMPATPLVKVEILSGNTRTQKGLNWKNYCVK